MHCANCCRRRSPGFVQVSNQAHHLPDNLSLFRRAPRLGHATRKCVGLHDQPGLLLVEPSAAISPPQLNEIDRPVVLAGPVAHLDLVHGGIHQHQASRPQNRRHAAVGKSDITVAISSIRVRLQSRKRPNRGRQPIQESGGQRVEVVIVTYGRRSRRPRVAEVRPGEETQPHRETLAAGVPHTSR